MTSRERPQIALTLIDLLTIIFRGEPPLRIRAWDGSEAGPQDVPCVVLRSPAALRRVIWTPGELGLARAYVTGELDIEGDLADGLRRVWAVARNHDVRTHVTAGTALAALRTLAKAGGMGWRPQPPGSEARPKGRLHSRRRDAQVISHHYDLSNALYELLLDENLAYSCAYWAGSGPAYTLVDAQRDKLDLICRKLDLRPGARLLDVGCGWGALAVHAAQEYGARVVGVTLSAAQLTHARARVERAGLSHLVELRLQDYRDVVTQEPFDAIAAIEMGEHVGAGNYPMFLAKLRMLLRPAGRLVIQQMSRGSNALSNRHPGGGPFIERYIAPDMHMRPLHETVGLITAAGLEVRDVHAMREHYVRTVAAWHQTFEQRWDDVVDLVGEEQARVWRLYLVGGALAFEQNRMGVDQILAVRTTTDGGAGVPPTRLDWEPHAVRGTAVGVA